MRIIAWCVWDVCLWCAPACVFVLVRVRAWVERVWMWFARLMCGGVGCDDDDVLHLCRVGDSYRLSPLWFGVV